jgi:hypothetical protein
VTLFSVTEVTQEEDVMGQRFNSRLDEMLEQAHVPTDILQDLLPRLEKFVEPFAATLPGPEHQRHAAEYVTGLVSKLERKTGEGMTLLTDLHHAGGRSKAFWA